MANQTKIPFCGSGNVRLDTEVTEGSEYPVSGDGIKEYVDAHALPSGGTAGQVLKKTASGAEWGDAGGFPIPVTIIPISVDEEAGTVTCSYTPSQAIALSVNSFIIFNVSGFSFTYLNGYRVPIIADSEGGDAYISICGRAETVALEYQGMLYGKNSTWFMTI